jgi:hypothetical protein
MAHSSAPDLQEATANQRQRLSGSMDLNRSLYSQGQVESHRLGEALENAGGAHAATDAHGDHAVAGVAAFQFA